MEPIDIAFAANSDGAASYYIDTGASSHFIDKVEALHNYVPFESPKVISTAENGTIQAFGSGTLKFASRINGRQVKGELTNVYYIPEIHHWLISVGKLFAQGWEARLSPNELTLYDANGRLVICAPMKNNVYLVTLQTVYPDFGLIAGEANGGCQTNC